MSKGVWRVRKTEIARSIKSVESTGLPVRNVEITVDGTIRVNIGVPGPDDHVRMEREAAQ